MGIVELIEETRSGVVQVAVERERRTLGLGSGFLVEGGLVTNSHSIRSRNMDVVAIRFDDSDPDDPSSYIRIDPDDCVVEESYKGDKDFAYLRMSEPEFRGRHVFRFLEPGDSLRVGQRAVFMGFPFGMKHLTSHIGFVSSIHVSNGLEILQIDGSINGGNSGGPLIDPNTGRVAGIVTRAVTGLVEKQFKRLLHALQENQKVLAAIKGFDVRFGAIDPIQVLRASQAAMEQIAKDLHRSANVGIGYAYSAKYVRDAIRGDV